MAKLKPCPFCGGEVDEIGGSCNFGKKIMLLKVKCRKCGTSVSLKTAWNVNAYLEAVEAWNRGVDKCG
jgi:Lar family restriction alleviation protein|nr:MAG TPA: restriction alleviation protein [Caudoviricetes sp.]